MTRTSEAMTPREPVPEMTPRVGRWSEHRVWYCDGSCMWGHAVRIKRCENCGTIRPPLPETPAPTLHNCDGCAQGLPVTDGLHYRDGMPVIGCTAARYALPTPSPRFLTDAQVLGREPIAGVDDAGLDESEPYVREAMREFALIVSSGATGDFEALANDHHAAWESIVANLTAALDAATLADGGTDRG